MNYLAYGDIVEQPLIGNVQNIIENELEHNINGIAELSKEKVVK